MVLSYLAVGCSLFAFFFLLSMKVSDMCKGSTRTRLMDENNTEEVIHENKDLESIDTHPKQTSPPYDDVLPSYNECITSSSDIIHTKL